MSFIEGRVSYTRFKLKNPRPKTIVAFTSDDLDLLAKYQFGTLAIKSMDGSEHGWIAGSHVLDKDFTLEKNIVNDVMLFSLRIDKHSVPSELRKAYYMIELKALASKNPSGFASAKQKREARGIVNERIEHEIRDGKHRKQKAIPVMWDAAENEILVGSTSVAQLDLFIDAFQGTFKLELEVCTAGGLAHAIADRLELSKQLDKNEPTKFSENGSNDVTWNVDNNIPNYLGNEFLMWLWWFSKNEGDQIDGIDITFMFARTLKLDCPRGMYGTDSISYESPIKLGEAVRAIQGGKLPRKAGFIFAMRSDVYEFNLQAEMFTIGSLKLPSPPEEVHDPRAILEHRIECIRELNKGLDAMYRKFIQLRLSLEWDEVVKSIQKWLKPGKVAA